MSGVVQKSNPMIRLQDWLWDCICVASVIGIWPRFIETQYLALTRLTLPISGLTDALAGLKILHFSDLHWGPQLSSHFLKRLSSKINQTQPDLIVYTGDFLIRSHLHQAEELRQFLCSLQASVGCFTVLGNHDYQNFVSVNAQGDYDMDRASRSSNIVKGFKRLFSPSVPLTKKVTSAVKQIDYHAELLKLLAQTPFKLLNNTSQLVPYHGDWINICGLEEYTLGRCHVDQAFLHYQKQYPGIILLHNPDAIPLLTSMPGDLILAGHTHGGQVNLPGLWQKFTQMEQPQFKRGLKKLGKKWGYINRGISGALPFRWFSTPELTLFTLQKE